MKRCGVKKFKRLAAVLMLVSFILSTAVPALAGGIKKITDIDGGGGGSVYDSATSKYVASDNTKTIYFGNYWQSYKGSGDKTVLDSYNKEGIKWRVLATNAPLKLDGSANTGVLLLSDQELYADGFNPKEGIVNRNVWGKDESSDGAGDGISSEIRTTLNSRIKTEDDPAKAGFAGDAFSVAEYAAIAYTKHMLGGVQTGKDIESTDKIFLLSREEAMNTDYGFANTLDGRDIRMASVTQMAAKVKIYANTDVAQVYTRDVAAWWLRSPGCYGTVYPYEYLTWVCTNEGKLWDSSSVGNNYFTTRPALNLDQDAVLFVSAAKDGKGEVAVGDGFALDNTYEGAYGWKLTLKDASITAPTNVTVTQKSENGLKKIADEASAAAEGSRVMDLTAGVTCKNYGDVTVTYNSKDANATHVSAIVATGKGTTENPYVYENYAKVSDQPSETTGRVVNTTNLDPTKEYTVFIFAEQANGDYQTDYASETQAFKINNTGTANYGILAESYAANGLTALLGGGFDLGFEPAVYDTVVTVVTGMAGNITADATEDTVNKVLIPGTGTTTLTRDVTLGEGATLTTAGSFDLQGTNEINGTADKHAVLQGSAVTIGTAGNTTTVGQYGEIKNSVTVASAGTLEAYAAGLKAAVTNNGIVNLNGGELGAGSEISGSGATNVTGTVTTNAKVSTTNYTVGTSGNLTTNAQYIGTSLTVDAGGFATLTTGTLAQTVTNAGTVTAKNGSTINSGITNTGAATLETGATFGASGKITGGDVTLGQDVHFKASNLGTIGNLTAEGNGTDTGAVYDFDARLSSAAPDVDKITITTAGKATGSLKLGSATVTDTPDAGWAIGETREAQYLEGGSGNDIVIVNTTTATTDGYKYEFGQAKETDGTNNKIGWMSITKGNGYDLWQIVQNNPDGAGSVDTYTLLEDYKEGYDLGGLVNVTGGTSRNLTIQGNNHIFSGTKDSTEHEGIATKASDALNIVNVKEISGWKNGTVFTNAGTLNFSVSGTDTRELELKDGITNTGTVTFGQNVNLTGKLEGAGTYVNNGTMTVADASKLAMTGTNGLTNSGTAGIVNLGGGELGAKITGGTLNVKGNVTSNADYIAGGTNTVESGAALTLDSGTLGKGISSCGSVTLETGASFGESGKITGGDVTLGQDVRFKAGNLGTIAVLTTEGTGAIYNFGANLNNGNPLVDQITITDEATGKLQFGTISITGTSTIAQWNIGVTKNVQYLKNTSGGVAADSLVITSDPKTVMSAGFKYTFAQAKQEDGTTDKIGWISITKDNGYTLPQIIQNFIDTSSDNYEAGQIEAYGLSKDYESEEDLGTLTRTTEQTAAGKREFTIYGSGHNFSGTSAGGTASNGVTVANAGDVLNLDSMTIEGWNEYVVNNTAGQVKLTGAINLNSVLKGAGKYLNDGTLTAADAANLAMTGTNGLTNSGTVNLGGATASTLGAKITGGTLNVNGDVTSNANYIAGTANNVSAGAVLTLNGGTLGSAVSGNGTVKVLSGTINAGVTTGTLEIDGNVTAEEADYIAGTANSVSAGAVLTLNAGTLGKGISSCGSVTLETGATFGDSGKITGGNVTLGQGVQFKAENLGTIKTLTSNEGTGAVYNAAANITGGTPEMIQITVTDNAAGTLQLGSVNVSGIATLTEWGIDVEKEAQYLNNGAGGVPAGGLAIGNTKTAINDGYAYTFSQAKETGGANKTGWLKIKKAMGFKLPDIVQDTAEESGERSGDVAAYALARDYAETEKDLGTLKRTPDQEAAGKREFTIYGNGYKFSGTYTDSEGTVHTYKGITVENAEDVLSLDSMTIEGWNDHVVNNTAGQVKLTGAINLNSVLKGAGEYLNDGTLTAADAANLAMPELTNSGTVNLGGTAESTLNAKITGGNLNVNGNVTAEKAEYIAGTANNVSAGAVLTLNGGTLGSAVSGDGTVKVLSGTINAGVTTGTLEIDGNVTAEKAEYIAGTANSVSAGAVLTLNDGTLGSAIDNAGTVKLDGANLGGAYVTAGTLEFAKSLETNADYISTAENVVDSGVILTLKAGTLGSAIDNAGTVKLDGASLDGAYVTAGTLEFVQNLPVSADYVKAGKNMVYGGAELTLDGGTLTNGITSCGSVTAKSGTTVDSIVTNASAETTLEEGAAFGTNGKISGGKAVLKNGVQFSAANLDGIAAFDADKAVYNFSATLHSEDPYITPDDIIHVSGDAVGEINLGVIKLNGISCEDWLIGTTQEMQYMAAGAGSNLTIKESSWQTNTGYKYTFSQAKDGSSDIIGYMSVLKEGEKELTLKNLVNNNPPGAGLTDGYWVDGTDTTTEEDLGSLDNTLRDGVFSIAGTNGNPTTDILDGGGNGGIIVADTSSVGEEGDVLNLVDVTLQNFKPAVTNKEYGTVTLDNVIFNDNEDWDIINEGTVIAKTGTNEFDKGISGEKGAIKTEGGAILTGQGAAETEITGKTLTGAGKMTLKDITVKVKDAGKINGAVTLDGAYLETTAATAFELGGLISDSGAIKGKYSISDSLTVNDKINFKGDTEAETDKLTVTAADGLLKGREEETETDFLTADTMTAAGNVTIQDINVKVKTKADIKGDVTIDDGGLEGGEITVHGSTETKNGGKISGDIIVDGDMVFKGPGTNEINGKATPYGYLDFYLDGYSDKDVIVHCNGTFDLSHVKTSAADGAPYGIRLFQDTDPHRLPERDQYIALIEGGVTGYKGSHNENLPDEMIALRSNKALTAYKYGVYEKDGTLYAACMDLMTLQRGKSLAEGRMAAMTALNEAGDLITDNVIRTLNVTDHEWQSFASVRGTHGHYETGSYVDTNGTSVAGGLARKLSENTTLGIFAEGGYSHYNSHNDMGEFGIVTAKGDINYFGGGILLRSEADATDKGSLYGEASVRAGRQSQDYDSETILPGTSVRYDADSRYIAAHAGVGYKHKLKSGNTMDTYVKYLYSHQGGVDLTLDATGETVNYDPVESHRVRAGFRYTKEAAKNLKAFGGLAYEYEFSNEAASSTEGLAIAAPDMKGGSGVAELGITYKKPGSPWEIDFSINGAAGKRESISATLTAWYEFGRKGAKKAVEKVLKPAEPKETKKAQAQPKTIAEAQRAAQVEDGAERFEKMFGGRRPEIEKAEKTDRKTPDVQERQKQTDEQLTAGAAEQKQAENKQQGAADAKRRGNCVNSGTLPAYLPEKKKPQPAKTEKQRAEKISRPEKPEKPQTLGYDAKTGEVGGLGVLESPLLITR